jgi:hypothetical protein
MFSKNKKAAVCPVDDTIREWIESCFVWFSENIGKEVLSKKILVPHPSDFPIAYDGSIKSAMDTLQIVATQMDVDPNDILLQIYSEGDNKIAAGRSTVFIEQGPTHSGGLYHGKSEDGKYHIHLEQKALKDPESIVATLAHEIAHIKLLGENRIEENNEPLTDLTSVYYGTGIFNANCAFKFTKNDRSWGYKRLGYISQMEWGYALAIYAYLRNEEKPDWANYLSANIKSDFRNGEAFILENTSKLLVTRDMVL